MSEYRLPPPQHLPRVRRALRRSVLALALATGTAAHANTAFVIVGGNALAFAPQTLDINAGDTVTFLNFGGLHNVVADDGSFRCARGCDHDGHGGSGAPSSQLWSVSISFPKAGSVGYFCETHGAPGTGMFGTINVAGAPPPPLPPDAVPLDGAWLVLLAAGVAACAVRRASRMPVVRG